MRFYKFRRSAERSLPVWCTLRDFEVETEWVELVVQGCNVLAGSDAESISRAYTTRTNNTIPAHLELYGNGDAGRMIVEALVPVP